MFSGYYTIASGLITNQRAIETISNNIDNALTPGYRSERVVKSSFEQELLSRMDSDGTASLSSRKGSPMTLIGGTMTSYEPGAIKETGRALDVAINGEGFFSIRGTDGQNYLTRNGSFSIDDEGYLTLAGFGRVQGATGDIRVGTSDIDISSEGIIRDKQGNTLGTLSIIQPADLNTLTRSANGMFIGGGNTPSTGFEIIQSSLESSNVDLNTEITNLIAAQRDLQSCASALKIIDSMDRKSAQIASV
ncbi:MAG: flagellar hook-basal body protein [Oscillospiraceae bacterium]|jgi:flagellar basal-body rod protein FlgF